MTTGGRDPYSGFGTPPVPGQRPSFATPPARASAPAASPLAGDAPVWELPRVVLASPASGQGTSTVAVGVMAALTARRLKVSPHKVGPDYLDPGAHALACGRTGRNLDPWLVGEHRVAPLFVHGARVPTLADVAVVEGAMGLHDGRVGNGWFASTAHVAALLDAPVVLVVDVSTQARSAAAVVLGMRSFDPRVRVAGVILNCAGSDRHTRLLREAMAEVGAPVLGIMRRDATLVLPSPHAGQVPTAEREAQARTQVRQLGDAVAASVDLEALLALARSAPPLRSGSWDPRAELAATPSGPVIARAGSQWAPSAHVPVPGPARWSGSPTEAMAQARQDRDSRPVIAVARGAAFSFSYAENTELLEAAGARVVEFDPLRAPGLPDRTKAVVLGGGFPEEHAEPLSANRVLLSDLWSFDGPIVAECAGLLYLGQRLDGVPMIGRLPIMSWTTPTVTAGYREATAPSDSVLAERGATVRGHEFHRTRTDPASGEVAAWQFDLGGKQGFVQGWVHASYLHLNWAGHPWIASRLVEATLARL